MANILESTCVSLGMIFLFNSNEQIDTQLTIELKPQSLHTKCTNGGLFYYSFT